MPSCQPQGCCAGSGAQNALILAAVPKLCYLRSNAQCMQCGSLCWGLRLCTSLKLEFYCSGLVRAWHDHKAMMKRESKSALSLQPCLPALHL